jgi:hypothetical protein
MSVETPSTVSYVEAQTSESVNVTTSDDYLFVGGDYNRDAVEQLVDLEVNAGLSDNKVDAFNRDQ